MASLETLPIDINDHTYHVTQLPAKKGRALLVKLIKVLGPVFGQLIAGMKPGRGARPIRPGKGPKKDTPPEKQVQPEVGDALRSINGQSIARALTELAGRLNEADLEYMCSTLGEYTAVSHIDSPEVQPKLTTAYQEFHFAGKYGEMFEWIGEALAYNYRDFFSGSQIAKDMITAIKETAANHPKDTSQSESLPE